MNKRKLVKLYAIAYMLLLLTSCRIDYQTVAGIVKAKQYTPSNTIHTPAQYRYDCWIDPYDGYTCDYRLIPAKTSHIPASYILFVEGDGCELIYEASEKEFLIYDEGDRIVLELLPWEMGTCGKD